MQANPSSISVSFNYLFPHGETNYIFNSPVKPTDLPIFLQKVSRDNVMIIDIDNHSDKVNTGKHE